MKLLLLRLLCFSAVLASCKDAHFTKYNLIPHYWVYAIAEHNDSLYFSTREEGIFSWDKKSTTPIKQVARFRSSPFRSLYFSHKNILFASSYYTGVFTVGHDTVHPVPFAPYPAWSMKFDEQEKMWVAGTRGIYRETKDSLILFNSMREGHDVAFRDDTVAIAHRDGISFYNKETGCLIKTFAKGNTCWSITRYAHEWVGGGVGQCLFIRGDSLRVIRFKSKTNILWATAQDTKETIYLATQQGLLRATTSDTVAQCVGFKGKCIKSLLIDNKGKLWVGRYYKPPGFWLF